MLSSPINLDGIQVCEHASFFSPDAIKIIHTEYFLQIPHTWRKAISLVFFALASATLANAEVARRIPDVDVGFGTVNAISHFDGETWIGLEFGGVFRITGDSEPRHLLDGEDVISFSRLNDATWVLTKDGLYRIKGDSEPQLVLSQTAGITAVSHTGNETWITTKNQGAFRIDDNMQVRQLLNESSVDAVFNFKDATWLIVSEGPMHRKGAYQITRDSAPLRIPDEDLTVNAISRFNDETWLATDKGAYAIKAGSIVRVPINVNWSVDSVSHFGGEIWIIAHEYKPSFGGLGEYHAAIFRMKPGSPPRQVLESDSSIKAISTVRDEIWLSTDEGAYRVTGDSPAQRISDENFHLASISHIEDTTWLLSNDSDFAYRVKGNAQPEKVYGGYPFASVSRVDDETWFASIGDGCAYRSKGDSEPKPFLPHIHGVHLISHIGKQTWISSYDGAYRIDRDVVISGTVNNEDSWWKKCLERLFPQTVWVSGEIQPTAAYLRLSDHQDPYPKRVPREFTFVMERSESKFNERFNASDGFIKPEYASLYLASGSADIFLAVRDRWGNTFKCEPFPIHGLVLPGPIIIPFIVGVFWLTVLTLVVVLAPFSTFCHDLLMNPFVRKYGSFGFVPLALTLFPPIRHHLLRRYFAGLRRDASLAQLRSTYVVPSDDFLPDKFGARLHGHNPILLSGSSGIGKTSFLRYLQSCYTDRDMQQVPVRDVVPVFIPLVRYQGVPPKELLHAQLANYGRLTDDALAGWFLEQGGFLFLLDGLNEVDNETRQLTNQFVDQYKNRHYFCLSSQHPHQEYAWIDVVKLASFSPEKVQALIRISCGEQEARQAIDSLAAETYAIYAIPQDLHLGITLLREGKRLPVSRRELYEASLAPVVQDWINSGHAEFAELLACRAFTMLRTKDPFFDNRDEALPADVTERLVERKILVMRNQRLLFQHDLVRAYLAARYLVRAPAMPLNRTSVWERLLTDPRIEIDQNWRTMLEFAILEIGSPEETRKLLLIILTKSPSLAAALFRWTRDFDSLIVAGWSDEFSKAYGKATLG